MRLVPLAALVLAACTNTQAFVGECATNSDCPVGSACRKTAGSEAGVCVCRSDEACQPGEVCNSQGICQKRAGCRSNVECSSDTFCDLATGACIQRTACGTDVHCLPGTVCENGRCVDGCHNTGDCPLYRVCQGGTAVAVGTCISGSCDDKSFCDFGSTCENGECAPEPNPDHCKPDCSELNPCDPGDFCLVNSAYDPNNPRSDYETFCGVECDEPDDCPNGYDCGGVVLLTQDQCTSDAECGGGGRQCFLGEGDLRGFCSCNNDQDCAFDEAPPRCVGSCGGLGLTPCTRDDECLTTCEFTCQNPQGLSCTDDSQCQPLPICQSGLCITDASPCSSGIDCLCQRGECVNTGRPCTSGAECNPPCINGGCFLGSACAPEEGLLCTDVR